MQLYFILQINIKTVLAHKIYCTIFQYDPEAVNIILQYSILHNIIYRLVAALSREIFVQEISSHLQHFPK